MVTVPNATLGNTGDGTPYSAEFGDIYHSADGGLAQARHVFLAGNGLPERWREHEAFTILETGFGLGLNFLAAWDAWRGDPARCQRLHFVSIENRPFSRADLQHALSSFAELAPLATALIAVWPPPLAGFHRLHFDAGRVILTLIQADVRTVLPQLVMRTDAFFLDGFAPAKNPTMWSPEVVRELRRLANPGATLASWTVAGGVRAALGDAGFIVEKRAGFGTKRQMLVGRCEGEAARPARRERQAMVIGAGLAGTLAAERLASRGWQVDLIDGRADRSAAAVGLLRPIANLKDAVNAQLSRSAFLYALQHYRGLAQEGFHLQWQRCGVLQLADDDDEVLRFEAIVRSQGYPEDFMQFADAARAREIASRPVRGPGWWFPSGSWVSPESLGIASLARADKAVRRLTGLAVKRLDRAGDLWRALDAEDRVIAEAPTVVVANASDAKRLLPEARLTLSSVRGQVTYLPASTDRQLDVIVSGSGYVAPLENGGHVIGASYHHDDADESVRAADHRENLVRAESMLPGFTAGLHPMGLPGWTGYRATVPDRLPIFGAALAEGIHLATGLGSRGLLWAPLGAELLVSSIEGEPVPLGRDHAGAISPRRFLS